MADAILAGLAGAGLGVGANRAQRHAQIRDPDRGAIHRRRVGARKHGRKSKSKTATVSVKNVKRVGKKKVRFTKKSSNGTRKKINYKNKKGVAKFSKQVQQNILYPCTFKVTNYVGNIVTTNGSGSDMQLGNMLYRVTNPSASNQFAQFEIWRMTSLAKTFDATTDGIDTPLSVGTNGFSATSTEADIISGANQSKCLRNQAHSHSAVSTLGHYTRCNGTPNFDLNPNYLVSGFNINLQFLSYRQVKQQLCVRLVRIRNQALEDCWGQSQPGSSTKTLDLMCGMVNSNHHIDPNEYDVLYECKTIIPGFNPGALAPKITYVKKYYKCNYMMTMSKKKYQYDLTKWGAQFTPFHLNDTSYYNNVFLAWSVRPIQNQILTTRQSNTAPGGGGSATLDIVDSFTGGINQDVQGSNTTAQIRVNGTLTTYGRAQAIKRIHA